MHERQQRQQKLSFLARSSQRKVGIRDYEPRSLFVSFLGSLMSPLDFIEESIIVEICTMSTSYTRERPTGDRPPAVLSTENVKSLWTICFVSFRRDLIGRAPRLESFGATFIRSSLWMWSRWFSLLANQMPMPFRQDSIWFRMQRYGLHVESDYFRNCGPISFRV